MTEQRARWMTAAMTIMIIVVVSGILFLFFFFQRCMTQSLAAPSTCGSGAGQVYSAVSRESQVLKRSLGQPERQGVRHRKRVMLWDRH